MISFCDLIDDDCTPEEVVSLAANALANFGIETPYSTWDASTAVLVAESVNHAAKTIDEGFYLLKPRVIDAAMQMGCKGGWGDGDGVFYLHTEKTGVACFHDPMNEIKSTGRWTEPWSRIPRQNNAFSILSNKSVLRLYAEVTSVDGRCYGMGRGAVERCVQRLTTQQAHSQL